MANRDLGPSGGYGGTSKQVTVPEGAEIVSMTILWGSYVNAVSLGYRLSNGQTGEISVAGGDGAANTKTIKLPSGLQIRTVMGTYGAYINSLTIVTNDGDVHGPYGSDGPAPFRFEIPECTNLVGLLGRPGKWLDAFGIVIADKT